MGSFAGLMGFFYLWLSLKIQNALIAYFLGVAWVMTAYVIFKRFMK